MIGSRSKLVLERFKVLCAAYNKNPQSMDADVYLEQVEKITRNYSDEILIAATSPETGMQSRLEWFPKLVDWKRACEDEAARRAAKAAQRQSIAEQAAPVEDRSNRPTYDELIQRCIRAGLPMRGKNREYDPLEAERLKSNFGLSQADWDAIPDRPNSNQGTS